MQEQKKGRHPSSPLLSRKAETALWEAFLSERLNYPKETFFLLWEKWERREDRGGAKKCVFLFFGTHQCPADSQRIGGGRRRSERRKRSTKRERRKCRLQKKRLSSSSSTFPICWISSFGGHAENSPFPQHLCGAGGGRGDLQCCISPGGEIYPCTTGRKRYEILLLFSGEALLHSRVSRGIAGGGKDTFVLRPLRGKTPFNACCTDNRPSGNNKPKGQEITLILGETTKTGEPFLPSLCAPNALVAGDKSSNCERSRAERRKRWRERGASFPARDMSIVVSLPPFPRPPPKASTRRWAAMQQWGGAPPPEKRRIMGTVSPPHELG